MTPSVSTTASAVTSSSRHRSDQPGLQDRRTSPIPPPRTQQLSSSNTLPAQQLPRRIRSVLSPLSLPRRQTSDMTSLSIASDLSPHQLRHLRSRSRSALRFAHDARSPHAPTPSPSLHHLYGALLSPVSTSPSLTIFLPYTSSLHNAFHSLLALLSDHRLQPSLYDSMLRVAAHPYDTSASLSPNTNNTSVNYPATTVPSSQPPAPRDAIANDYLRAVAACPPRIPAELRTALAHEFSPERKHQLALLSSVAAFHSTMTSLLGLLDVRSSSKRSSLPVPMSATSVTASFYTASPAKPAPSSSAYSRSSKRDNQRLVSLPEPSEVTAPSSSAHSAAPRSSSPTPPTMPQHRSRFMTAAHGLRERVARPLLAKRSRISTTSMQRAAWLSHIPSSRTLQAEHIRSSLGFTPFYLDDLRTAPQRAAFIYLIEDVLLADSMPGVSVAVKLLSWFVLARAAENPVLVAQAAFLAVRFGADERQLRAAIRRPLLAALHRAFQSRAPPSAASSSSLSSSLEDEEDHDVHSLSPGLRRHGMNNARTTQDRQSSPPSRADHQLKHNAGDRIRSVIPRRPRSRPNHPPPEEIPSPHIQTSPHSSESPTSRVNIATAKVARLSWRRRKGRGNGALAKPQERDDVLMDRRDSDVAVFATPDLEEEDMPEECADGDADDEMGNESDMDEQELNRRVSDELGNRSISLTSTETSSGGDSGESTKGINGLQLFGEDDEPDVPIVHGLNALRGNGDGADEDDFKTMRETLKDDEVYGGNELGLGEGSLDEDDEERLFQSATDEDEDELFYEDLLPPEDGLLGGCVEWHSSVLLGDPLRDEQDDMMDGLDGASSSTLFTAKEVAILLLSHQVAAATLRNSRQSEKFANAHPGPLLTPRLANAIHELFSGGEVMEVVGVIGAFHVLQRWTTCFPYGAKGLEPAVKRFARSSVARAVGVGEVGQRSSSKFSETLRLDCRSLRLPRHAVVDPHELEY